MILLINEELGAGFPLVSIEEFMSMSFIEIDLLSGPKLCQLNSIWIKNRINKIARCHLNKLDGSVITEKTSNDTHAHRFQTKHSLLIFSVQETLYYLNMESRNKMPYFRRPDVFIPSIPSTIVWLKLLELSLA